MEIQYVIEICIAIDIAILGIAYPIIIDKISNIGNNYSSQYISVLFNYEFPQKVLPFSYKKRKIKISFFKFVMYITLLSFLFLIFPLNPLFGLDNWFINNSAKLIVLFLSSTLTILFFIWLDKINLYNGKSKSLLKHLINKYNSINEDTEKKEYHLKAINELTFYAIERQDEHLQETLLDFYYDIFTSIRKNHDKSQSLVYPVDLYFLVNKLNYESNHLENKKLRAIEHRAVSGNWLLGEDFEEIKISEETYTWLWKNIYSICDNSRLLRMFWANSSQYFNLRLRTLSPNYIQPSTNITNEIEIKKRDQERKQFLEFHFALGGLLLYRNQYDTIKYNFEFSQSQPPTYVLLPNSMTEIFYWFENFRNDFKHKDIPIDLNYYFPELDNLGNSKQVNYWIGSYITILFLRQYSLHPYFINQNFTSQPNLPDDVIELSNWMDSIPFFEYCLNSVLENKTLLSAIKFENIAAQKNEEFKQYLKDLKVGIETKIGSVKLNAQLSDEKIASFLSASDRIINSAFHEYNSVFVCKDESFQNCELKISINGNISLMSKSAFTDGDVPNLNYNTVFANAIATDKIKRLIPNSFLAARTKQYLFNKNNIFEALSKIIDNCKDIVIVGINITPDMQIKLNDKFLKNKKIYIPSTNHRTQNVIFLLNVSDLPAIEYREIKEETKADLQLSPINSQYNIFGSVIDINKEENKVIKNRWQQEINSDDLDLKVQLAITFLSVIYWKNERNVVQINIASEFKEQGIQNDISEIKPFEEKPAANNTYM